MDRLPFKTTKRRAAEARHELRPRKIVRYLDDTMSDTKGYLGPSKLPPEIIAEIASYCDFKTQKAMSLVSHGIRSNFIRPMFASVRFKGASDQMSGNLKAFLSSECDLAKKDVYGCIRHATFVITVDCKGPRLARQTRDKNEKECILGGPFSDSSALPSRILQAIQSMSRLQSLHLDIEALSPPQKDTFLALMAKSSPWKIRNLTVTSSWGNFLEWDIINHCAVDSLEGLDTKGRFSTFTYASGIESQKRLKKLVLYVPTSIYTVTRPLPVMLPDPIKDLAEHFKDLEWLVLNTKCVIHQQTTVGYESQSRFDQGVDNFIKALRHIQSLKRLAFALNEGQVEHLFVQNGPSLRDARAVHDQWYIKLIHRIGDALPQLEDLCILHNEGNFKFRGIRMMNGVPMAIQNLGDQLSLNTKLFPLGFDDD